LGQSRGPEDTSRVEAAYVGKGAASSFTINNFVDHMNETCSTNVKGVKEIKKVIVLINLSHLSRVVFKTQYVVISRSSSKIVVDSCFF